MGTYVTGTADDAKIDFERMRIEREMQEAEPIPGAGRKKLNRIQDGGCSGVGAERYRNGQWLYCPDPAKCSAVETVFRREVVQHVAGSQVGPDKPA